MSRHFFMLLLATTLFPSTAFGSLRAVYELDDLSLTELEATFGDFKVVHKGAEIENKFDTEVYLSGTVFQKCWDKFEITNTTNDEELRASKKIGFRVHDLGGGRECQKALRNQRPRAKCTKDHPELNCVRLSQVEEARMNLSNMGDGPIEIVQLVDGDETRVVSQVVDVPHHVSRATALASIKKRQDEAREKKIKELKNCVDNCRGSLDKIAQARESAGFLMDLGEEINLEKINRDLDMAELALIEKEAEKASPEDFQEIRERMAAWADEHPESADAVASAYRRMALKAIPQKGAKASDYDLAASMIAEAQSLQGLSSSQRARFERDQLDIQVSRMQAIAMDGYQNNMTFLPNYHNLMQQLQMNAMQSCQGAGASLEGCSSSMQVLRSASMIPQTAMQVDQSRWQLQMQIQQQMQMAFSPQQNQGIPGTNPMLNNTSVPAFQNPGQNPAPNSGFHWGGGQFGQMTMAPPGFGR